MKFDLFKLHSEKEDFGARSFVRFKGKYLYREIELIIKDIVKRDKDILNLSKEISISLGCHKDTVIKILKNRTKTGWIAIPIILELMNKWKLICNKNDDDIKIKELKIQEQVEEISTGVSVVRVKAVRNLTVDLAFLAGAHHADGHLGKEVSINSCVYRLQFLDHYRNSLEILKNKIYELFNVKVEVKRAKSNAWEINFKSKVIGRYFERILGFPAGNKIYFNMPKIIKNSSLEIREAYVRGFLTFDGSVETDRNISIGIRNKELRNEIYDIISLSLPIKKRSIEDTHHIRSGVQNKEKLKTWQKFFEDGSEKWFKLNDYVNDFIKTDFDKNKIIKILENIFQKSNSNKIGIGEVISKLEELRCCDKFYLAKKLNVGVSTLYRYFHILEKANILKRTNKPLVLPKISFNEDPKVKLTKKMHEKIFSNIKKEYNIKQICNKINISESTYQNWKNKKHGISLNKFFEIGKITNLKVNVSNFIRFNKNLFEFNENYKEWLVPNRPKY